MKKIFVTTALPYINGELHIGHIMEYIQADIWVRFKKITNNDVYFICADDSHGIPIMIAANDIKLNIKKYIQLLKNKKKFFKKFFISFDFWSTTDNINNYIITKKIYLILKNKKKIIIKKKTNHFFDPIKNIFLQDRYIKGNCPNCNIINQSSDFCENCGTIYNIIDIKNPHSILSKSKIILKSSKDIFLNLSNKKCINFLKQWLYNNTINIKVKNKIKEWLNYKLKNWNISRNSPYFGIKIPKIKNKFFYVWFDAMISYLSSFKNYLNKNNINFESFILNKNLEQYHFIGKDIIYFHILFFPILLKFSKLNLPKKIFIHGFITYKKKKISKSKKNSNISLKKYLKLKINTEYLRYYFASKINSKIEDLNFNKYDFIFRINSELIGKYINIISRISIFIKKKFNNLINNNLNKKKNKILIKIKKISIIIKKLYNECEYNKIISIIMKYVNLTNFYINKYKPWKIKNNIKLQKVCSLFLEIFKILTIFLKPILPRISNKIEIFFNYPNLNWKDIKKKIPNKHVLNNYTHLINRIQIEKINNLFKN